MLKRIKLIERVRCGYMLCHYGDLYISKVEPGWKAPYYRGKVTGQGLWGSSRATAICTAARRCGPH